MTAGAALLQPRPVLMLLSFGPHLISAWEARGFRHCLEPEKETELFSSMPDHMERDDVRAH